MTDLTRDELDDLLGAWAVDALDDDDRVAVEAALARHPDLAETARDLREGAALLGRATDTPADGLAAVVAAATSARPPGRDARLTEGPATRVEAYADQVAALSRLLDRVPDDAWDNPVDAYPWSVRDLVAHLIAIEQYSASFLGFEAFEVTAELELDHLAMTAATIERCRSLPVDEVVAEWRRLAERSVERLRSFDDEALDAPMPLHGLPFGRTAAAVARAFELWTHADDVRKAIGEPVDEPPPAVLHCMASASVGSLALAVLGLEDPPGPATAHVVLTGRGGGTWDLVLPGAEASDAEPDVTLIADVVDYCRVVSRRLDIDDLDMTTEGDAALARTLLQASQFVAV
ncbi:MAG TPA: maleylpyruvate isomerase family mycothiol-dependent enzyme [Acidimicrobiales bacterium]|nr:maleylpyruvate isomerase family mycothiol-dependent enzyme [Acidimicrobiales bacterium]